MISVLALYQCSLNQYGRLALLPIIGSSQPISALIYLGQLQTILSWQHRTISGNQKLISDISPTHF
jgi:hypothetical protein